jgi:hypothetical protein
MNRVVADSANPRMRGGITMVVTASVVGMKAANAKDRTRLMPIAIGRMGARATAPDASALMMETIPR